jgi:putative dimethyl sulfoxide reductase chaperone
MREGIEASRQQGIDGARSTLAHADLLLLFADLLRPPGRVELPMPDEAIGLVRAALPDAADSNLIESIRSLLECARKTPWANWSDEYHRLFEGPIACPINETTYVRRDKGAILADICGFYRAFGFEPSPDVGEKPDHLRGELEFLAALFIMEARALEQGNDDHADITRQAIIRFASDHLTDWLASFCARLMQVTSLALYGRLAEVLPEVWQALAAHRPLPQLQQGDPDAGDHEEIELDPMPCGGAAPDGANAGSQSPCTLTVHGEATDAELAPNGLARGSG